VSDRWDRLARTCEAIIVSCLEGKPREWDRPGRFRCKSCGATSDKKKKICKPAKIGKKK
jgi:hypothetical protein